MMRKLLMAGIAILTIAISSCDEDTNTMGYSLTSDADRFSLIPDTFQIDSTKSIKADSVLARSSYSYLGRIKDPESRRSILMENQLLRHAISLLSSTAIWVTR